MHEAARVGLAGVAIADHDTVAGVLVGWRAAASVGIELVPALEINTDYGKDEVHILGYYIDPRSENLRLALESIRDEREGRAARIVKRLNSLGVSLSLDRVLEIAGGGSVGRPHLARALVEAGHASSLGSAFGRFLVRGSPAYVPRYKLTPAEAIGIIESAGGVPVLAHPGLNKHDEIIPQLADEGLKGIEVYHSDHSHGQSARYLDIAKRYGLVPTGGSDSHGPDNVRTVTIGSVTVGMSVVEHLRSISNSAEPCSGRMSVESE